VSFLEGRRVRAPRGLLEWARALEEGDAPAAGWSTMRGRTRCSRRRSWDCGWMPACASPTPGCRRGGCRALARRGGRLADEGFLRATAGGFRVPRAERARTDAIVLRWRDAAEALGYTANS
jgi:hypothetical protein